MALPAHTAAGSKVWCDLGVMAGPTTARVSIAVDTPQRTTRLVNGGPLGRGNP